MVMEILADGAIPIHSKQEQDHASCTQERSVQEAQSLCQEGRPQGEEGFQGQEAQSLQEIGSSHVAL